MPAETSKTETVLTKEVPEVTGASPPKRVPEKTRAGPVSGLSPTISAERYSALLAKTNGGNGRGMPQAQLFSELQKRYGNRYTERVVTDYRTRSDEAQQIEPEPSAVEEKSESKAAPSQLPISSAPEPEKPAVAPMPPTAVPAATPPKTKVLAPKMAEPATEKPVEGKPSVSPAEAPLGKVAEGPEVEAERAVPATASKAPPGEQAVKKPPAAQAPEGAPSKPEEKEGMAKKPGDVMAKLLSAGAEAFKQANDRIRRLQKHQKTHKKAKEKLGEATEAVKPPAQEAQSRANAKQVELVSQRKEPQLSEAEAKRIRDAAIERATPKTVKDVDEFQARGGAQGIRNSVLHNIKGQTSSVQNTYSEIGRTPKAEEPQGEPPPIPEPEAAPPTSALNLGKELVTAVPAEDLDMRGYENEVEHQIEKEGVDVATLEQVDSGPLAEAMHTRTELKKDVKEGPAEVQKQEQIEKSNMEKELRNDETRERAEMHNVRKSKLNTVKGRQSSAKKSEEEERKKVTDHIQKIYQKAKASVEEKLSTLETVALKRFDDGQKAAADKFEYQVKREMLIFKAKRYTGASGLYYSARDWWKGIDDLPQVKAIFVRAKNTFIKDIDTLVKNIMTDSKKVIDECKTEIQNAEKAIAEYVQSLKPSVRKIGEKAQQEMADKLKALDNQVDTKAEELKAKLNDRREKAIKALDQKIAKMKEKLKGMASKIGNLLLQAALKLFKWALEKAGAPADKIVTTLERARSAFTLIIKKPVRFLGNLIEALGQGFKQFSKNILIHLKQGLISWLFGTMAKAGITMPTEFSIKAIFGLVLEILGLTPAVIKEKVAKYIGKENVERITKAWEFISTLISKGVGGLWEMMKEYLTNLKELVIDAIQDWLITQIIKQAVLWIISLFNPVAAIIKAIMAIYKVVMFIIENIRKIIEVMVAILESLVEIATGAIGKAAGYIEKALGRLVPIVIGFLASLLGLSGISDKIRGIVQKLQARVHNALDKVIAKIAARVGGLLGRGKKGKPKKEEEALPADKKKLWTQGQAAIEQLKKRSETEPLDEKTISQTLREIKEKYKFTKLDHRLEGTQWVIISQMNPKDKDKAKAKGKLFKVDRHIVTAPGGTKAKGESHHVPFKVLKRWIGEMYILLGKGIGGKEGKALQSRGEKYEKDTVGESLSAIWLTYKDHKKAHKPPEEKPSKVPDEMAFLTRSEAETTRPLKVTIARGVHEHEVGGDEETKKSRQELNAEIYEERNTATKLKHTFKKAFSSLLSKGKTWVKRAIGAGKWEADLDEKANKSWAKILDPKAKD